VETVFACWILPEDIRVYRGFKAERRKTFICAALAVIFGVYNSVRVL
jgi:hypothetical protein